MSSPDRVIQTLYTYLETQQWSTHFSAQEMHDLEVLCQQTVFDIKTQSNYWSRLLIHWDHRNLQPHRSVHSEILAILNIYLMALHQHHHHPLSELEPLRWKLAETQVDLQQKSLLFWRFEHDQIQERLEQLARENDRAQSEFYTLTELADFLTQFVDDNAQLVHHALDALQGVMGAQSVALCFQPAAGDTARPYFFRHGQLRQEESPLLSETRFWKQCWKSLSHQVRTHYFSENDRSIKKHFPHAEILLWQTLSLSTGQKALLVASSENLYTFNGFHTWFTLAGVHIASALNNASLNSQLNEMAIRDGLMGIYNRRYLEKRLIEAFKVSQRYQRPLSVLMVDIDHFKAVNDTYGHPTGDEVLRRVSQSISERLRTTDILGRYGGEEFLILLPETDLSGASKLAQSLVKKISETPIEQLAPHLHITVSIGVSSYPEQVQDAEALVATADQHLYEAKHQGRNRYTAGKGA